MRTDSRNLKYVILGLLSRKPMTGYDISKEFSDKELNEFWYAKHSQIYPELKRLLDEGLVEYDVQISGETLEKKVYRLTPAGRKDFLEWLGRIEPLERTPKNLFRLRMYHSSEMDQDTRCRLVSDQLEQRKVRLEHLKSFMKYYDDNGIPASHDARFGDYVVLRGAIIREKGEIQWLEECLALCLS